MYFKYIVSVGNVEGVKSSSLNKLNYTSMHMYVMMISFILLVFNQFEIFEWDDFHCQKVGFLR